MITECGFRIVNLVLGSGSLRPVKFEIRNSKFEIVLAFAIVLLLVGSGCAHRQGTAVANAEEVQRQQGEETEPTEPTAPAKKPKKGKTEKGLASWYGEPYHGRRTASGEVYDMHGMTAAHRTLAFGTVVRVTRRDSNASVKVRVNDRGPFIEGRIIDLSYAAAKKIALDVDGLAPVKVEVLGRGEPVEAAAAPPPTGSANGACVWVQVGAFSDLGNARRLEMELEKTGEEALVLDSKDGLYRVRVGPFSKEREAEKALKRVRNHWPEAQLVPCG